jgi:hypothetical protein
MDLDKSLDELLAESPLTDGDVKPQNISDIFHKDTEDLTREDIQVLIDRLRDDRRNWHTANSKAKASGKRTPPSAGVKLEDLELDLDSILGEGTK